MCVCMCVGVCVCVYVYNYANRFQLSDKRSDEASFHLMTLFAFLIWYFTNAFITPFWKARTPPTHTLPPSIPPNLSLSLSLSLSLKIVQHSITKIYYSVKRFLNLKVVIHTHRETHTLSLSVYIYIYIYVCVCVCVCVCVYEQNTQGQF